MRRIAPVTRWVPLWLVVALVVEVVLVSRPAVAGPVEPKPTPPDLVQAVESARRLGQLLYLYDKDAADASDAAEQFASGRGDPPVRGWIVDRDNGAATVTFFTEQGDEAFPVYRVHLRAATAAPVVERAATTELPTSEQRSMWRARKTALSANVTRCSRAYNTVVLRGDAMKLPGWLVYLIPATAEPGRVLVGGYYRVHVSAQGDKLLSVTPFSKSCLAIPAPEAPPGAQAVGAYFNHLLSDAPTETHVFLSKLHRKPMYVATRRGVWNVDGDTITFLGTPH
jgi:hypothetical protein